MSLPRAASFFSFILFLASSVGCGDDAAPADGSIESDGTTPQDDSATPRDTGGADVPVTDTGEDAVVRADTSTPMCADGRASCSTRAECEGSEVCAGGCCVPEGEVVRLRTVSGELDNLYRYNVNSDTDLWVFEKPDGKSYQLFSYWSAPDRRLNVVEREFPYGAWGAPVDVHDAANAGTLDYDSHNASAVAVSAGGDILATGNYHTDPVRMARSQTPFDLTGEFENVPSTDIIPRSDRATYPAFAEFQGFLYFSVREQNANNFRWHTVRYDHESGDWDRLTEFSDRSDQRSYLSEPTVSPSGERMFISGLYRAPANSGADAQKDLFVYFTENGSDWRQLEAPDDIVSLPLNQGQVPHVIWDTDEGGPVPTSAGHLAVDCDGNPWLIGEARGDAYHLIHWNGERWIDERLSEPSIGGTSIDIFQCGCETYLTYSMSGDIFVQAMTPEVGEAMRIADDFVTSDFSHSIDRSAIQRGYLSMLLTENEHHSPRSHNSGSLARPAYTLTVSCEALADFGPALTAADAE